MHHIYHVAKTGCDCSCGSADQPFASISKAAAVALPGDSIIVHAGVYREEVKPERGGRAPSCRIVYAAAPGEKAVIKGSEIIKGWSAVPGKPQVWKVELDNSFFGDFNPYTEILAGDWLIAPYPYRLHLGEVYLNGQALYEVQSVDEVAAPQVKTVSEGNPGWYSPGVNEPIPDQARTLLQWCTRQQDGKTVIYANFGDKDPNVEEVEINVRNTCFSPAHPGCNYLTLRGFEICQAATQWAPPTGVQRGMVDTFWSKGWIIEHCVLHDAKTSAISIGKEYSTGDNESTHFKRKPGYQTQMEAVFKALKRGWSRELIGSHRIVHNTIHDCGQNAVVGHLGCIFSEIAWNKIYNIATKYEFFGYEIAGIKLHAAIDVQIHHNEIRNCALGTWLDWQAQGTRVSCNVYHHNFRDLMIEVTHGPCIVDNNIFASAYNFDNVAQGTALIHNLFAGYTRRIPVLDRATPYHLPHSTDVAGVALVYSGDDRVCNNIFAGGDLSTAATEVAHFGTAHYDGHPASFEEYNELSLATGNDDHEAFNRLKEPVCIDGNAYLEGAPHFAREEHFSTSTCPAQCSVQREADGLYLNITLDPEFFTGERQLIETALLGEVRITECAWEAPDGQPIVFDRDLCGALRTRVTAGPLEALHSGVNHIKIAD